MSFTKTNWEDYPSENTIISAARLNAMEDQIASALDGMESDISGITEEAKQTALAYTKTNIRLAIQGLFPNWAYTRIIVNDISSVPTLLEAEPYYEFTSADFVINRDGLNIWNGDEVVSPEYYTLSKTGDAVRVAFNPTVITNAILAGNKLTFDIFVKE